MRAGSPLCFFFFFFLKSWSLEKFLSVWCQLSVDLLSGSTPLGKKWHVSGRFVFRPM